MTDLVVDPLEGEGPPSGVLGFVRQLTSQSSGTGIHLTPQRIPKTGQTDPTIIEAPISSGTYLDHSFLVSPNKLEGRADVEGNTWTIELIVPHSPWLQHLRSVSWLFDDLEDYPASEEKAFVPSHITPPPSRDPENRVGIEAERVASAAVVGDDSASENFREQLSIFLDRYGDVGVQAIEDFILKCRMPAEFCWIAVEEFSRHDDLRTLGARRHLVIQALNSDDPGLRYSAAVGLGEIGDKSAMNALQDRQTIETNPTVLTMIKAQLDNRKTS